jgi:hypothetical protein
MLDYGYAFGGGLPRVEPMSGGAGENSLEFFGLVNGRESLIGFIDVH